MVEIYVVKMGIHVPLALTVRFRVVVGVASPCAMVERSVVQMESHVQYLMEIRFVNSNETMDLSQQFGCQ